MTNPFEDTELDNVRIHRSTTQMEREDAFQSRQTAASTAKGRGLSECEIRERCRAESIFAAAYIVAVIVTLWFAIPVLAEWLGAL